MTTRLAFGVGGAVAGSFIGQPGLGFAVGSFIGGAVEGPEKIVNEGQQVTSVGTTTSTLGIAKPITYATIPLTGNVIDSSPIRNILHEENPDTGGKSFGGGPEVTNKWYTAELDLDVALGDKKIGGIIGCWANETLLIDNTPGSTIVSPPWLKYKVYLGTENELPDPVFEALRGVGNVPAYRGTPRVVFYSFQLEHFNNQLPTFKFLVAESITESNSLLKKDFGGNAQIGALQINTSNSLVYHVSNSPATGLICQVYDAYSKAIVYTMRWPNEDVSRVDESGDAGLFAMPVVAGDLTLPTPANAHLVISTEFGAGSARLSFFDAFTGEYLGFVEDLYSTEENFPLIVSNENSNTLFKERISSNNFFSNLQSWRFSFVGTEGVSGPIAYQTNGSVLIPVEDREDAFEWTWKSESSYPYGTTKNGFILVDSVDRVDNIDYLCLIDDTNPTIVEELKAVTDGFYLDSLNNNSADITKIIWDSLNELFWVIGQADTGVGDTLFRAYDLKLSVVKEKVYTGNTFYTSIADYGVFNADTGEIFWVQLVGQDIWTFNTVSMEFTNLNSVPGIGGNGPHDGSVYHHGTNTYWKMSGGHVLDLIRLSSSDPDSVLLSSVFSDLCQRAGYDPTQYQTSKLDPKTTEGYSIDVDGPYRSKMLELQQAYMVDIIDKGDYLDFQFRDNTVITRIEKKELAIFNGNGTNNARGRVITRREMDLKLPGRTQVSYYNKEAEYEQNTQMSRREASYVIDNPTTIAVPICLTNDEAKQLAGVIEHLSHIEKEVYEISTFIKYLYLTPGDVVEIEANDTELLLGRIIYKKFNGYSVQFILTRVEPSVLINNQTGGATEPRDIEVPHNSLTSVAHLDIPLLLESQNNAGYNVSAVGMSESWQGASIYKSPDKQNWSLLTSIVKSSNIGTVQNALSDALSTHWDRHSSIIVNMRVGGELSSCTEEEALQGNINAVAIGINGRFEICNFVNAVLIGERQYQVDTFLRGRIGTEWVTGTHVAGDLFVLLTADDLTYVGDSLANLYDPFYYRTVSFGNNLYSDQVMDQIHTNNGVCLMTLAPAQLKVERAVNLDLKFTWVSRTRFPLNNFWSGEQSDQEVFEFLIVKDADGSTLQNPEGLTIGEYTYTRTQQLADGLPADDLTPITCTAYHTSSILTANKGRGYPATIQTFVGEPPNEYLEYCATIGMYVLWEMGEPGGSTDIFDTFGIYNGFTSGSPLRNQPSLFAGYGASTEYNLSARGKGGNIPYDQFDFLNFSFSVMVYPLETNSLGDQSLFTAYIDYGSTENDYVTLRWMADGTVQAIHRNTSGTQRFAIWSSQLPINQTTHFVITFNAPDSDTFGPFNLYANGVLVGTDQAKLGPGNIGGDDALEMAFGLAAETTNDQVNQHRQQVAMVFNRAVSATEVELMYAKTGL